MCHGSRDRRANEQFESFVRDCQQRLASWCIVGCQLEFATESLAQQLKLAALGFDTSSLSKVIVVPVLMAAGVHVREDIPAAIEQAGQLCPTLSFHLTSPIGQTEQLGDVLTSLCNAMSPCEAWVIWGHGSRRASFAREFEQVGQILSKRNANQLVLTAFAKQEPCLDRQIRQLYQSGYRRIGVLTGLLFPGWLSDRLIASARELEAGLPNLQIDVSPVLMPHELWVDAIRELVSGALDGQSSMEYLAA